MAHYYDPSPQGKDVRQRIAYRIGGRDFSFATASGVFASHRVDFGTALMLETMHTRFQAEGIKSGRLLDLGCGYGVVGIVLKRLFPAMEVVLSDINERAVQLARENAAYNQTAFVDIVQSDGFLALEGSFDHILTNPPIRAGKAVVHGFFDEAYRHLRPQGRLIVVIQKKQGAPSATEHLTSLFGNCEVLAKRAGFRVLRCVR